MPASPTHTAGELDPITHQAKEDQGDPEPEQATEPGHLDAPGADSDRDEMAHELRCQRRSLLEFS